MSDKYYHFQDEFSFKSVPFIVEVYDETHYWGRYDERPPCERRMAKLRPDYPYEVDKEWPDGADKHFHNVVWYEYPEKKWWFLPEWKFNWRKVEQEVETTVKEQVEDVMEQMVEEWNEHANPDGFADVGLSKPNL